MAEFKKLSDVEVVANPSTSANVLIEEDGVIKKAPKTAVGGAGGAGWDAIIDAGSGGYTFNSLDSPVFELGDYNSLKEKLMLNDMPRVLIKYRSNYAGISYNYVTNYRACYGRDDSIVLFFIIGYFEEIAAYNLSVTILPSGEITYDEYMFTSNE